MNVVWTETAKKSHQQNLDYLEKEWKNQVMLDYFDELDEAVKRITINSNLFPVYNKKKENHQCVLNKYITLYYKVKKDAIILLLFWNTRQNPQSLNL